MRARSSRQAKAAAVYTPPRHKARTRHRPPWHRAAGFVFLPLGLAIIILNIVTEFTALELLPGGHSPLYLILGITVSGSSLWWFGWLDRQG